MKSLVYPFNPPHIEEKILQEELKAIGKKTEVGFVFNPSNGNLIDLVQGNEREVTFKNVIPNMVVSHYHPTGDSFTRRDLVRTIQLQAIEMRAFGDNYLYVFRGVSEIVSLEELEKYWDENPVHSIYIDNNRKLKVIRNVEKDKHLYWQSVSKELGFVYVRKDRQRCIDELTKSKNGEEK